MYLLFCSLHIFQKIHGFEDINTKFWKCWSNFDISRILKERIVLMQRFRIIFENKINPHHLPVRNLLYGAHGQHHPKRKPKHHEQYKTVEIGVHEGVIPAEGDGRLEIGTGFRRLHLVGGTHVTDEGETEWHEDEYHTDGGLVGDEAGVLASAVVEGKICCKLETYNRKVNANILTSYVIFS